MVKKSVFLVLTMAMGRLCCVDHTQEYINNLRLVAAYCDNPQQEFYVQQRNKLACSIEQAIPQIARVKALKLLCASLKLTGTDGCPVISFVIPVYNRADTVMDSIRSIYDQNLNIPFEVIAVDDASTDASWEILTQCQQKYPHFFCYRNPKNMRAPATRNRAISYARGNYIFNVDSDDILSPGCVKLMLDGMQENGCDIAYFDELRFFYDKNTSDLAYISKTRPTTTIVDIDNILKDLIPGIGAGNRLFTKASWLNVGGYLEERGHDSWSFSVLQAANGYKAYVCPGSWYWHRLWRNRTNMYNADVKDKVNDVSPKTVLLEHAFLFDDASREILKNCKAPDGRMIKYLRGLLKINDRNALDALFMAYRCDDNEDYSGAYKHYTDATMLGLSDWRISLKKARAAFACQNFLVAKKTIQEILSFLAVDG